MDKVSVFGTDDLGSIPGGGTNVSLIKRSFIRLCQAEVYFFEYEKIPSRGRTKS